MQNYDWPGNVRELQNPLHHYITLKKFDIVSNSLFRPEEPDDFAQQEIGEETGDLRTAIKSFEKGYLTKVLTENKWHKSRSASMLGINRKALFKKMK